MPAGVLTAPPQRNLQQEFVESPPVVGMDGNSPLAAMPSGTAVYLYNLVPSEYGARTREGWSVWAQNLAGSAVKSLIPYTGQIGDFSQSRLFAVTAFGIYDVSTQGADNPIAVVTFGTQTDAAGFTSYISFTDPSGNQSLQVADSQNGWYDYNPATSTWTKLTTEVTGATPANVAFLCSHKNRIWAVERDSSDAWYLPPGAKVGAATRFQFGAKFTKGGYLVGLYTWTIDGGAGVDDYLVAVSSSGDVLAYQGTDPAQASTWNLAGSWFIGKTPIGRRVAIESGGDLLLLSVYGVTSLQNLLAGFEPSKIERNISGKVARFIRNDMITKKDDPYWEIKLLSEEGVVMINTPKSLNAQTIQYVLNLNRLFEQQGGGWGMWRSVPGITFEPYNGDAYFGTADGKVCRMRGSLDDIDINGAGGIPVEFSILTRFSGHGAQAIYKQAQFLRPQFVAGNQVTVSCKAVYDYALEEPPADPFVPALQGTAQWDVSKWDQAVWSGITAGNVVLGTSGYGRVFAVAVRGTAVARATLVSVDGVWTPWGFM